MDNPYKSSNPKDIPDRALKEAFEISTRIRFALGRSTVLKSLGQNSVSNAKVSFGDFDYWLPSERVLIVAGITPQMLRPLFNPQEWIETRGSRKESEVFTVRRDLPETIGSYKDLGFFPNYPERFVILARILGKEIQTILIYSSGEDYQRPLFHPDGRVEDNSTFPDPDAPFHGS